MKDCYVQGLKTSPGLEGKVVLAFTLVRPDGSEAHASEGMVAESNLKNPLVEACMLSHIQTAKFGNLHSGPEVRVRYPLQLAPDLAGK